MTKDLLLRGFDDEIHSKLGEIAKRDGVSLNSLVKDVVDRWIETNSQITKKHELIMYTNNDALKNLLRSINHAAQNDDIFNACVGPKDHPGMQFLTKQGWFNGTVEPYKQFLDNSNVYGRRVLEKIGGKINKKQLLVLAFLTGDLAEKKSVSKSVNFCKWYDKQNVEGITHCVTHVKNILSTDFEDALHLFETHDQVFIAKKDSINKIHITKENIHKLFIK
jgi:hypothetical protein